MPPVSMRQDHGQRPQVCRGAIELGFISVTMDGSLEADGNFIVSCGKALLPRLAPGRPKVSSLACSSAKSIVLPSSNYRRYIQL